MRTFDIGDNRLLGWRPGDGWTTKWRAWFHAPGHNDGRQRRRIRLIQERVRDAVAALPTLERIVIEGHYFDGRSLTRLADDVGVSKTRIQVLQRRALGHLRSALTDFVVATYGLQAARLPDCPICRADWRTVAEELLDEKTPDVPWGELARRLKYAVGWTPTTVQVLIGHQKHHRGYGRDPVFMESSDTTLSMTDPGEET